MGLFQAIKQRWNSQANLVEVANEVADRCIEAVWARVQHQVGTLAVAEARGYVRARSVSIMQAQLASVSTEHAIAASLQPRLYDLTVNAVVAQVQQRLRANSLGQSSRRAA